jgi:thioesterase domain-containing protein/acyl carrier protein
MSENGDLLPQGQTGEIVIRGANVMQGYESNPDANEKAFTNGWFRTGDQGYMDDESYLFITGRLKEIINRAGEKIAPREVDEVLMTHPDVVQAVTFAVPHARLGEDVAAAVVLRDGVLVKERRVQEFAAERLADFKVPRRIVILDEIPKGPTGKLQRIGLAEKLGLDDLSSPTNGTEFVAPRTSAERKLAKIWAEVIGIQQVGIRDNFFDLGGDSRTAAQMLTRVQKTFGKTLPLTTLFHESTVEQMAGILSRKEWSPSLSTLVPIQTGGSRPPFFCIHGCFCEVTEYFALARHLGQGQPLYGLRAKGIYGEKPPYNRIEAMAAHYIREMKTVQPEGPYFIGTSGGGGLMALEVAQQLLAQGQEVGLLVLIDCIPDILFRPDDIKRLSPEMQARVEAIRHPKPPERRISRLFYYLKRGQLHRIPAGALRVLLRSLSRRYRWRFAYSFIPRHSSRIRSRFNYTLHVRDVFVRIQRNYTPRTYPGRIVYFRAEGTNERFHHKWSEWAGGGLDVHVVPGDHHGILREPHVRVLAERLRLLLNEAQRR